MNSLLLLGAGTGLEAVTLLSQNPLAVVKATDYNIDSLKLLSKSCPQAETEIFDITSSAKLPYPHQCSMVIASDLLYNDDLAFALAERVCEAVRDGKKVVVSDSQRFHGRAFITRLNEILRKENLWGHEKEIEWRSTKLKGVETCSMIEEGDVKYDVDVNFLTF